MVPYQLNPACKGLMLLLLLSEGEDIGLLLLRRRGAARHLGLLSNLNTAIMGRRGDDVGDDWGDDRGNDRGDDRGDDRGNDRATIRVTIGRGDDWATIGATLSRGDVWGDNN
jgi:hypothetical protein